MIICDGNNIAARAFFATHYGKKEFGEYVFVNAFIESLTSILEQLQPFDNWVVLCIDSRSWRYGVYPLYKQREREEDVEKLYRQYIQSYLDICTEMRRALPINIVKKEAYEADDLVAYFVINYSGTKIIVSSDKDLKQLIDIPKVQYFNITDDKFVTDINTKMHLHKLICLGDNSDTIPSICPVTADGKKKFRFGEKTVEENYDENSFLNIREKFIHDNVEQEDFALIEKNYERNKLLIDLRESPIHKEHILITQPRIDLKACEDFLLYTMPATFQANSYGLLSLWRSYGA